MTTRTQDPAVAPDRDRRADGFVLAEAVLALVVAVLAVWLALDLIGRAGQRRRGDRFVAELRDIAATFERYARQPRTALTRGGDDTTLPIPLAASLKETAWFHGPPFGGVYEWIPPAIPDVANRPAVQEPAAVVTVATARGTWDGENGNRTPVGKTDAAAPAAARTRAGSTGPPAKPELGTIAVTAFAPQLPLSLTRADLEYVDRQIDDGNLTSGRFRAGFNGWPVYTVGGK